MTRHNLKRFHTAQENSYQNAFTEIKNGQKTTHWMWFIFPQIAGLGNTEISKHYAIKDLNEAELYLKDGILAIRLILITKLLLVIKDKTANQLFGRPGVATVYWRKFFRQLWHYLIKVSQTRKVLNIPA